MEQIESKFGMIDKNQTSSLSMNSSAQPELCRWLTLVAEEQNKAAFTHLYTFFAPKIRRFGLKQFGNESHANDLVQETMTNVWNKAHLYDANKGAATTWIYAVMRNASFDYLRKIKSKDEQTIGDDIWPIENALANDVASSKTFPDHLLFQHVEKLVDSLPQNQQAVLRGVYFQQLSHEQLAKQLDLPVGTVKSRLRLALEKIRSQMGEENND
jgi:RNA polymerase sigma-70 factor (ECF subfamily)